MIKRTCLLLASLAAVAALAAPAAQAAKPEPVCFYVPDLDGHVWGPVCVLD